MGTCPYCNCEGITGESERVNRTSIPEGTLHVTQYNCPECDAILDISETFIEG